MWWHVFFMNMLIGLALADSENTVEGKTIREVESILAKDKNLPRLTRGEIISLLTEIQQGKEVMVVFPQNENITTTEQTVSTTKAPRKTMKRRRKPQRPVYKHSTTIAPTVDDLNGSSSKISTKTLYITPSPAPLDYKFTTPKTQSDNADLSSAADGLGDDMKQLLNTFGLLSTTGRPVTTERTTFQGSLTPSVDPSSFSNFKPLTLQTDGMSSDMKSLLSSFGLFDDRKGKFLQESEEKNDVKKGKKLNHVFNPATLNTNNSIELNKVNKILTKLKEISEGNATDLSSDDVEELLLIENNTKLSAQENIEPYLDNYADSGNKKEKRQDSNSTATENQEEAETTTVVAESSSSTDSMESGAELQESFGDGDPVTERQNGFYFLLDWNSFLDVGLEERKVNVNFSPKVGDPKQFISVKIP